MNNQHDPNPYAPTAIPGQVLAVQQASSARTPTLGVLAVTLGGVLISGSAFGMILGVMIVLLDPTSVAEIAWLIPLGMVGGGVIAGIVGIPTVIVWLCLSAPVIPLAKGWLPHQTRNYAAICGFTSGFAPLVVISPTEPWSFLISIVPGVFGALGTSIFARWINRPAKQPTSPEISGTLAEQSGDNVP